MAKATPGRRVADRHGNEGTVVSVHRGQVLVSWDDGFQSHELAHRLHAVGGSTWRVYAVVVALSLGLTIALSVWLL